MAGNAFRIGNGLMGFERSLATKDGFRQKAAQFDPSRIP